MGFGNEKTISVILGILMLWVEVSMGKVYKVGDVAGWTTIGNLDYKQWASTKTFQVGDIIVFKYNPQFHNVMQVTHPMYKTCNASSPIATHTTGNDSITITTHGHHFFLCGVPGHCQAGQKLDINVLRPATAPTVAAAPALVAQPSEPSPAPSPSIAPPTFFYGILQLSNNVIFLLLVSILLF